MKKKITYITESSGYGGAEKYLLYLVDSMKEETEISVALPFKKCNDQFRQLLECSGATTIDVPQFMALYPLNLLIAFRFFSSHKNALLHFSLPYTDSCRWLLTAAALLRLNYLMTEHLVPPYPYQAGPYFALTHFLFNPLKQLSYLRARQVLAVSQGNRDSLVLNYGMPAEKLFVVHNGIDCSLYGESTTAGDGAALKRELDIPEGSLVLTNVARLAEQKGQKYLVEALEILAREHIPMVLLLIGDGPLKGILEEYLKTKGLTGLVRLAGFRTDIPAILAITDIFILASLNEGFPLTLLEAMAAGKPAVATRITGTPEAIKDGETGLLCLPASPTDLAEKIRRLASSPELRKQMGACARQTALNEFDVTGMIEKTRRFYAEDEPCAGA